LNVTGSFSAISHDQITAIFTGHDKGHVILTTFASCCITFSSLRYFLAEKVQGEMNDI
jgi:hypothetical protein